MKIGIVARGGGSSGVNQAGQFKAVEDYFGRDKIEAVSCASVGSLNGAMYVQGGLDTCIELWKTLKDSDVYRWWPRSLKVVTGKSYFDPSPFHEKVDDYINRHRLRVSPIKLYVNTTNSDKPYETITGTNEDEDICEVIKASGALPVVFPEHYVRGAWCVDGGVSDNGPMYQLIPHGINVICVLHPHPAKKSDRRYKPRNRKKAALNLPKLLLGAGQQDDRMSIELVNRLIANGDYIGDKKHIEIIDIYPEEDAGLLSFEPDLAEERIKSSYEKALRTLRVNEYIN